MQDSMIITDMDRAAKAQAMADFTANERRVISLETVILAWCLAHSVTFVLGE